MASPVINSLSIKEKEEMAKNSPLAISINSYFEKWRPELKLNIKELKALPEKE